MSDGLSLYYIRTLRGHMQFILSCRRSSIINDRYERNGHIQKKNLKIVVISEYIYGNHNMWWPLMWYNHVCKHSAHYPPPPPPHPHTHQGMLIYLSAQSCKTFQFRHYICPIHKYWNATIHVQTYHRTQLSHFITCRYLAVHLWVS